MVMANPLDLGHGKKTGFDQLCLQQKCTLKGDFDRAPFVNTCFALQGPFTLQVSPEGEVAAGEPTIYEEVG